MRGSNVSEFEQEEQKLLNEYELETDRWKKKEAEENFDGTSYPDHQII